MYRLLKRYLTSAFLLGSMFSLHTANAAPPQDLKGTNVVLVHGAFADGSSWDKVIPLLGRVVFMWCRFKTRLARSRMIRLRRGEQ